jgi:hypothetical protein
MLEMEVLCCTYLDLLLLYDSDKKADGCQFWATKKKSYKAALLPAFPPEPDQLQVDTTCIRRASVHLVTTVNVSAISSVAFNNYTCSLIRMLHV